MSLSAKKSNIARAIVVLPTPPLSAPIRITVGLLALGVRKGLASACRRGAADARETDCLAAGRADFFVAVFRDRVAVCFVLIGFLTMKFTSPHIRRAFRGDGLE